jgi:predicted transcriptional regulator
MTERKNINLTLSVPPEIRKKLRQLAVDREQSLSEIVIELIKRESAQEALSDTTTKDNS